MKRSRSAPASSGRRATSGRHRGSRWRLLSAPRPNGARRCRRSQSDRKPIAWCPARAREGRSSGSSAPTPAARSSASDDCSARSRGAGERRRSMPQSTSRTRRGTPSAAISSATASTRTPTTAGPKRSTDQYVREIVLLGGNAVENIPFQDTRVSPLMPISREAMNRRLSAICKKYDVQYWLWTPADFDLKDSARRSEALQSLDALFADLPRLDAIFLPGGDPGDNAASLVVPYLADIATRLKRRHPAAKVWLSLQHFDTNEIDLSVRVDRSRPAGLAWRTGGRSGQLSDSRDSTPAQPALSPARLPRYHAHGAVPVPGALAGTRRSTSRSAASR